MVGDRKIRKIKREVEFEQEILETAFDGDVQSSIYLFCTYIILREIRWSSFCC